MNITKSNSMKLGYAGGGGESEGQTFVVHKDTNGYGLTLFGYRPVFVQTVKAKGAADRAGIKERDIILQVNGINVTESSHDEVVDIIKGDKYVALTISRMKHESHSQLSSCPTSSTTLPHYVPSSILSHSNTSIVTAPQPPNSEAVRILTDEKYHTIQLMAEQERRNVDGLRQNLVTLQPESDESLKKQEELDLAQRRLIKLEDQLDQMREKVQNPNRTVPRPSSSSDIPPPLPARNKNMTAPSLPSSSSVPPPPTLPPRQVRTLPPLPPPIKPNASFNFSRIEPQQQHPPCKSPTMSNLSDPPDSPRYETPPGTPPPPYALKGFGTIEKSPGGTTHFQLTQESILKSPFNLSDHFNTGAEILNMEDDDDDDEELSDHDSSRRPAHHKSITTLDEKVSDVDGPFNNLRDLLCHHAHLSVFLNFVISISDPAPLLFYLITDSYKQGSLKEMQRWAYEIHSCFLVPGAPLPINKIENNTVNVIDRALQEEFDKEEILRRLFWKVRLKCRKDIKYQLLSFCEKKENGLGGIFGPSELELRQCIDNRNKELQVIENLMIPLLDSLTEDLDNATERSLTIASSLATILSKTFVIRNPTVLSLVEKCPTFVSKEKKSNKLFGRNKKSLQVQGHNFELKQYYEVTYCNQSQIMIWGIGPQGYRCSNCGFDVYRKYVQHVEETCVATGPSSRRKTRGGVFSRILSDRDLSAAVPPWKSTTQSPNTTKEIIPSSSISNDDFLDDPNSTLLSVSSALLFDQAGGAESSRSNAAALPPSSGNSSTATTTAITEGKGGSLHDLRSRDSKMDEARVHSRSSSPVMQKLIKSKAAESISSPPLVMEVAQEFVLFGEESSSPKSPTAHVFDSKNPCPPQPPPPIHHPKKRFDKRTLTSLFLQHHGGDSSVHHPQQQHHHQSLLRRASITSFSSGSSSSLVHQSSLEKKGPRLLTSMFVNKKNSSHHQTEPLPHPTHRSATLGIPSSSTRRRRSIAITDDAYDNALRMAKSHLDLSAATVSATSSPLIGKKNKLSLKDRSWGELEKLLSRHKDKETSHTSLHTTQNNPPPSVSSSPAEVKKVKRNKAAGRSKTYPTRKSDEEFFTSPVFEKLKDENRVCSEDEIFKDGEQIGKKVGRAQSCKLEKEQPKSRASNRERRKHSDPNIPRQTSSDVEGGGVGVGGVGSSGADPSQAAISNQPSGSSSTSSLSARSSLDSPAGSLQEMVSSSNPNSNLSTSSRGVGSNNASGGAPPPPPPPLPPSDSSIATSNNNSQHPPFWDSDFETEPDPPDWRFSMNQEDLVKLKPKEKKRQDVINEFFHTERSHVRNLKVLDRIFYRPMLDNPSLMSGEMVQKLFPNLDELIQIHTKFNQIMKDRIKSQGFPIGDISDLFLEMFDGPNGDTLIDLGSEFTKNQKFTIEELKKKRARDHKFDAFLSDLERRPECRRLGLESILPVEHQRLVKYPLLLEQLSKQTPEDSSYSTIKNCVERTKFILDSIDKRVAEAQNLQRLAEIQKNLDTSGLEKNPESSIPAEYKNCDLTKHRLIYDGPLTLKLGDTRRFKTVDLHVVLLEDCIMLLQKQDDKYLLKFHTSGAASSTGDKKFFHSPIIEFSTMLVRPVATDKRAFYLLNITQTVPQIYELVASSSADRSQWFRHITEASNAYRARDNRRNFRTTGGISPLPDTGSNNNSREISSTNGLTSSTSVDNTRKDSSSLLGVKGILPAGRSHSFHESSSSSRESPPERQPSSPPEDITKGDSSVNEGAGGSSGSTTPRKRLQRVEILKIAEQIPLIDPSQVVVTQGEILVADPVLTPIEKLRRKDLEISKALLEKQRIIADIFQIPTDDFDAIADIASQPSKNKDAREVLLAALAQANSLSELLNESLNLTEEDTIAVSSSSSGNSKSYQANRNLPFFEKAIQKSSNINQFLTSLLAIFQMREEERDRSRHCLQRYQDQIDVYLSDSTTCPVVRPASFTSVEENSSGIQDSEEDEEKRAEKSQSTNQSVSLDIAANVEGVSESSNPNSGERAILEESIDRKFQVQEVETEGDNESDESLNPQEGEGLLLLPETNDVVIKTEDEDHTKCLTNPAMEETSSSTGDSPKDETEQSDQP